MTQNDMVLTHLKAHRSLSTYEAFTLYGITRLSARIADLRSVGHIILAERTSAVNRFGEKVNYCKYILADSKGVTNE